MHTYITMCFSVLSWTDLCVVSRLGLWHVPPPGTSWGSQAVGVYFHSLPEWTCRAIGRAYAELCKELANHSRGSGSIFQSHRNLPETFSYSEPLQIVINLTQKAHDLYNAIYNTLGRELKEELSK